MTTTYALRYKWGTYDYDVPIFILQRKKIENSCGITVNSSKQSMTKGRRKSEVGLAMDSNNLVHIINFSHKRT